MPVVHVDVKEPFTARVEISDLVEVVEQTLLAEGEREAVVTVVITTEEAVRELNRTHRGMDAPTDVLAFPTRSRKGEEDPLHFPLPPECAPYLGDVVIAFPVAARHAATYGQPVEEELRLLAVHGVLHLLGYDHATPEEEAVMWARQEAILGRSLVGPRGQRGGKGERS